ncbi:MAG: DinB family protein [Anaerolineae bacterium]|jgi:hypothetical protein|nr:DinB family protein [Anaerolineae bacterium]
MATLDIVDELLDQFGRTWQQLRDAIIKTPAGEWRRGKDAMIPARLAYHVVRTADIYATHRGYEEHKPHRRYRLDWEGPVEALPERDEVFTFVNECEAMVREWLITLGDEGLMEAETQYAWTGTRRLGRALYLLRHNQWHIAEINTLLRERGFEAGAW